MNLYYFIAFIILNQLFYIKRYRPISLLFSMLSTIFLIFILPVEIDFIRYVYLGMTFVLYLSVFLLMRTFPSLEQEKKIVGKRYFSFLVLLVLVLVLSLLNILDLNLPEVFKSTIIRAQGIRISNEAMITVIGFLGIIITFVFSELRDGGDGNDYK